MNEKSELQEEFGKLIKNKRKEMKITQEQIAERIGITTVYWRDLEKGKYKVTWIYFFKICIVLEINITHIIEKYIAPLIEEVRRNTKPTVKI